MNVSSWLKTADHKDKNLILAKILNQDRTWLVSHGNAELPSEVVKQADDWVKRRKTGEPLAYLLGYKEFYGRDFQVTSDTLIPRPETELIINITKELHPQEIIEVGTGSGCVAISLALELPDAHIEAVDISEKALEVAKANRQAFQIDPERLELHKSNLLADIHTPVADVVIANLPYVDRSWDWLDKKVLSHEPPLALYAGDGGLALVNKLIVQFVEMNIAEHLILEADPSQHQKIIDFAINKGLKHTKTQDFICMLQV